METFDGKQARGVVDVSDRLVPKLLKKKTLTDFSHACDPWQPNGVLLTLSLFHGLMRHKQAAIERNWGRKVWTLSCDINVRKMDVMQPRFIASRKIVYVKTDIEYQEQLSNIRYVCTSSNLVFPPVKKKS